MDSGTAFYTSLIKVLNAHSLSHDAAKAFIFVPYSAYDSFQRGGRFLIFEDWWIRKPRIVLSKVLSILGISQKIHGRECLVKKINKISADQFLTENHILGTTNSKDKYGLFYKDELVSLATFAGQRTFTNGNRSAELLRFCHKNNRTVVGGFDKLLQAYIKKRRPDEIMTYVDPDWGSGRAFEKLGFKQTAVKNPMTFFVHKKSGERIPEKYFTDKEHFSDYAVIKNSGSLKMVKVL